MDIANPRTRKVLLENSATIFLSLLGTWKLRMQKHPEPDAETMDFTTFFNFSYCVLEAGWTKEAWSSSVHFLHEKGLVVFPSISPVDSLPAISLSSFGCSAPVESNLNTLLKWTTVHLTGKKGAISLRPEWSGILLKIFSGDLDPKDSKTWPRN